LRARSAHRWTLIVSTAFAADCNPGTITGHGNAVARLVPNMNRIDQQQARIALQRIQTRTKKLHQPKAGGVPFDWPTLKQLRDHGRP